MNRRAGRAAVRRATGHKGETLRQIAEPDRIVRHEDQSCRHCGAALSDTAKGFEVIPRRWVVERTFAWMTRWRRLVRDYEERIDCSEAMIHVALGSLLLRRIAHQ